MKNSYLLSIYPIYKSRKSEKGFTLIEALLAILIIGILVLMAMPRLDSTAARVRTVSRQIMDDMRDARTKAVTDGRDVVVSFPSKTQYIIDSGTANAVTKTLPYQIEFTAAPTPFTFHKIGSVSGSASLEVSKDGSNNIPIYVIASTGMVHY